MHASLLVSVLLGALPASKLGAFVYESSQSDATTILAACPRVVVLNLSSGSIYQAIPQVRRTCPGSQIVVRDATWELPFSEAQDPASSADLYWADVASQLQSLTPDWVEGPGENILPAWAGGGTAATWAATFFSQLADRIHDAGFRPLVGTVPPGTPPSSFQPIADAMKLKSYQWGWSYLAYSPTLSTDEAIESAASLGFRRIRDTCGLGGVKIVLSEGGQAGGWLVAPTSKTAYFAWLKWLDARLQADTTVEGVALFEFGNPLDTSSNLATLAADLASYLPAASFPPEGCDGGCTAADASRPSGSTTSPTHSGGADGGPNRGCATAGSAVLPALATLAVALLLRRR